MKNWFERILNDWKEAEERETRTQKWWEAFVLRGEEAAFTGMDKRIPDSWKACRLRGVDPCGPIPAGLDPPALKERRENNKRLLTEIKALLAGLAPYASLEGYRIDLYDRDLYLLDSVGPEAAGPLKVGLYMAEEAAGTTAVNLALTTKRPAQTAGHENYKAAFHGLTFCAVPLWEGTSCAGVLSIAGGVGGIYENIMALLVALSRCFSGGGLCGGDYAGESFEKTLNRVLLDGFKDGVIVLKSDGALLYTNAVFDSFFRFREQAHIGKNYRALWPEEEPFSEILRSGRRKENSRYIFASGQTNVILSGGITPFFAEGRLLGVVGIFKDTKRARDFVKAQSLSAKYTFENLIGKSEAFCQVIKLAKEVSKLDNNILIQGESGTGKELFAQAIHNAGEKRYGPFVAVNCSAIPYSLFESELFGYEGGAFTGAKKEGGKGKFEIASGGTIFLDEINSMPVDMQAKILRAIQTKTIMRVGGAASVSFDARIMAATNVDLNERIKLGEFRKDLYYRLNVIGFIIPPLRERKEDIDLFIEHYMREILRSLQCAIEITEEAVGLLQEYNYPGNVRELENILERSCVLAIAKNSYRITTQELLSYSGIGEFVRRAGERAGSEENRPESLFYSPRRPQAEAGMTEEKTNAAGMKTMNFKEVEKELLLKAIEESNGNITAAAQKLGISRNTIYRKKKEYELTIARRDK